jgi:hypothetical protein
MPKTAATVKSELFHHPSGAAFLWMADRWGSRPDGVKGHDFQFWSPPLRFASGGNIESFSDTAVWSASIRVGRKCDSVKHLYVWPKKHDPNPLRIDPCNEALLPPEE